MDEKDKELLDRFSSSKLANQFITAYGGDGTLLNVVAEIGMKKGIIPIRDYARCEKHANMLEDICNEKDSSALKYELKYSKHNYLNAYFNGNKSNNSAISEIVVKNADPTEAMRFSVFVNNKKYMSQCIADGFIFSSSLGSHGYFKSIARTMFIDPNSIGLAFLSPTYGICNLILRNTDKLKIVFERSTDATVSFDKKFEQTRFNQDFELELEQSCEGVALYGYDIFCCPECRRLRNSTIVNDQWLG